MRLGPNRAGQLWKKYCSEHGLLKICGIIRPKTAEGFPTMTILLVVISLVAGIALGQWFKILILVLPVMSLALVGTIAAGIARADNVWSITLMAIAAATALQIGYLIGISLRSFIVAARFARPSPASEATRRAPVAVARDRAGATEPHNEDQEHSIDHHSRDRTRCRRKVGPAH
jgi:hypothetical protein